MKAPLAALFFATACPQLVADTKIISRRGASEEAPGNTFAAFGNATSQIIEVDVRATSDGVLVCVSSFEVDSISDGFGEVADLTLAELQALDAGSWFSPEFSEARIPTLTEAITFITSLGKQVYIDRLTGSPEMYVAAIDGFEEHVYLGSGNFGFIGSVNALVPTLRLVAQGGDTEPDLALVPAARGFGVVAFEWAPRWITPEAISTVHESELEAWTSSISSRQEIRRMKAIGVDAILTPSLPVAREICAERDPVSNWGPVAHYPFDRGTGTSVVESISGTTIARLNNFSTDPTWTTGRIGGAYEFLGRGSFIRLPSSVPSWNLGNAVTISAWINPSLLPSKLPESQGAIFDQTDDAYALMMDRNTQELRFTISDADGTRETPSIPQDFLTIGSWHQVVGSYDGSLGIARIYLNGELIDEHSNPDLTGEVNTADPNIGRGGSNTNGHFHGKIDDVALWSRPLSQAEITTLASGSTGNTIPAGLVAHYPLDGSAEESVSDLDGIVNDGAQNGGWISDGPRGNAISLRGANDFVLLPSTTAFDMRQPAVTVNTWIRSDILPSQMFESSGFILGDLRNAIQLYYNISGEIRFRAYDTEVDRIQAVIPETRLTPGQWHMVTGVYSGDGETGIARTYLDGDLIDQATSTTTTSDVREAALLAIGTQGTRRRFHFPGDIDDLAIWNRALAPDEIAELFTSELNAAEIYAFPGGNDADLLDFAFGDSRPQLVRQPDGTLLFTYPRRPDARSRGIRYSYQVNEGFQPGWLDVPFLSDDTVIETFGEAPDVFETLGIPIDAPDSVLTPARFFRVQVSLGTDAP